MKKSLLLAIILFCYSFVFGQNELLVHSSDKGLYLTHVVAPKENFYSIGRLYNVFPKDIETYNGLDMNKGLSIGQIIKIPLSPANFTQASTNGRAVYYEVGEKEGLYRVSVKNNNVLMASLRKWNHLASDQLTPGKKLIVGYLVSPEANNITVAPQAAPEKKAAETSSKDLARQDEPEEKKEKVTQNKPVEKRADQTAARPASQSTQQAISDGSGGYFKAMFDQQVKVQPLKKDETATAGIFKTASGWQDAKYYALMDDVEPGTIVKIMNPSNNKSVYAKVLGEMSGIRQNQGYNIRMSNAAASALDINEMDKFIVRIHY